MKDTKIIEMNLDKNLEDIKKWDHVADNKYMFDKLIEHHNNGRNAIEKEVIEEQFKKYDLSLDEYIDGVSYFAMMKYLYDELDERINKGPDFDTFCELNAICSELHDLMTEFCGDPGMGISSGEAMISEHPLMHGCRVMAVPSENGDENSWDLWLGEKGTGVMALIATTNAPEEVIKENIFELGMKTYDEGIDFIKWIYEALDERQDRDRNERGIDDEWNLDRLRGVKK